MQAAALFNNDGLAWFDIAYQFKTEHIQRNARLIAKNAAWSSAMPPGNITEITPEERAVLASWTAGNALR